MQNLQINKRISISEFIVNPSVKYWSRYSYRFKPYVKLSFFATFLHQYTKLKVMR